MFNANSCFWEDVAGDSRLGRRQTAKNGETNENIDKIIEENRRRLGIGAVSELTNIDKVTVWRKLYKASLTLKLRDNEQRHAALLQTMKIRIFYTMEYGYGYTMYIQWKTC